MIITVNVRQHRPIRDGLVSNEERVRKSRQHARKPHTYDCQDANC